MATPITPITAIIPAFTVTPTVNTPTFPEDIDQYNLELPAVITAQDLLGTQLNTFITQVGVLESNVVDKELETEGSASNAAISAATATAAANRAEAAVLDPTGSAYAVAVANWRDSMMSKAEFNAMANQESRNNAGSGFIEFGQHYSDIVNNPIVNEGIWTTPTIANTFRIGRALTSVAGASKTEYPLSIVNGVLQKIYGINSSNINNINEILLPPAPTVLPYTATLTQQQIDSGVIKHADASNSGLIVNGKFDTDTSGWTATNSTLSLVSGSLRVTTTTTNGWAQQNIATVVGKEYVLEVNAIAGTAIRYIQIVSSTPAQIANSFATGYSQVRFIATTTTTYIRMYAYSTIGTYADYDNIAVFPADAISRSDLCFIEQWHEDVSEKDFVYPLGNVQYLGATGDSGTTISGAFAGSATYSLFSDTWQADSALVGKGYVWSILSDANKKAFVANPENNCYLDGDKVIQVRYRMRVVMGWGDSWLNTDVTSPTTSGGGLLYTSSLKVEAKGKKVSVVSDIMNGTVFYNKANSTYGSNADTGTFVTLPIVDLSYTTLTFALPIALISRRNSGFTHPVYNPNGTKLASDSLPWYSTTVSFTSIADCFTESKLLATSGYIGTTTGRPDGLFYDQIHEGDITDLRNNSAKVQDYNRVIDREFNKAVAGTTRGSQGEVYTPSTSLTSSFLYSNATPLTSIPLQLYVSGASFRVYVYGNVKNVEAGTKLVVNDGTNRIELVAISGAPVTNFAITYSSLNSYSGLPWANGATVTASLVLPEQTTRTKSNTLTHTDIIGSPANYPLAWKQSGISGVPLIVAEDGTSLLPTGTTGSDGLAVYKLSRKANSTPLQVLKSTNSGITWTALTVTTHYTFSTATNAITFTTGNIPLVAHLIRVTYQTHTNMMTATTNSEELAIGEAIATNGLAHGHFVSSLIGKVPTANTAPYSQFGYGINGYRIDTSTMKFSTTSTEFPSHTVFTLAGGASGVPAVNLFPYLTRSNGKAYLNLVFKEMKYSVANTSWGDDGVFNIVDNISTTTDFFGATVLIGQKRIELPYFIDAKE